MKARWIIVVAVAQVALLMFMAGEREWVLRTGRPIIIAAAPVDPNDPMRGAYVRLTHELSRVPKAQCRDGLVAWFGARNTDWNYRKTLRDQVVYASIRLDENQAAELVALSDRRPESGLFLRGRVESVNNEDLRVRYGVEALFMGKEQAQALEKEMLGAKAGVPLELEVAVSPGGLAVVRSRHWGPLGLTVTFVRPPRTEQSGERSWQPRPPTAVILQLKNHSAQPLAIVNRAGGRSFRMVSEMRWGFDNDHWVLESAPVPPAAPGDVEVLPPGQTREVSLDLTAPDWQVWHRKTEKSNPERTALTQLTDSSNAWYRFEYVPPTVADSSALPHAETMRHGVLRSRLVSLSDLGGGD